MQSNVIDHGDVKNFLCLAREGKREGENGEKERETKETNREIGDIEKWRGGKKKREREKEKKGQIDR